jgi:hypothetical protein
MMDKCSSLQLAFKMFCWLQAAVEDNVYPRQRFTFFTSLLIFQYYRSLARMRDGGCQLKKQIRIKNRKLLFKQLGTNKFALLSNFLR